VFKEPDPKEKYQIRILEQVGMILNQQPNLNSFKENVDDLLRIYGDVLVHNGVEENFRKSLGDSRDYFKNFPALNQSIDTAFFARNLMRNIGKLRLGDEKSFFLHPLLGGDHLFVGIIRKIKEVDEITQKEQEKYSFVVVNLGDRKLEENKNTSHIEYLFHQRKDLDMFLLKSGKKNFEEVDQIYEELQEKANEFYYLNIYARDQRLGNCYIKEFEKGIKTALIPLERLKASRIKGCNIKAGFFETIGKSTFQMHQEYIGQLLKENKNDPELVDKINQFFMAYRVNKDIKRIFVKNDKPPDYFSLEVILKNMNSMNLRIVGEYKEAFQAIFKNCSGEQMNMAKAILASIYKLDHQGHEISSMNGQGEDFNRQLLDFIKKMKDIQMSKYAPFLYQEKTIQMSKKCYKVATEILEKAREYTKAGDELLREKEDKSAMEKFLLADEFYDNAQRFFEKSYQVDSRNLHALRAREIVIYNKVINFQEMLKIYESKQDWENGVLLAKIVHANLTNTMTSDLYKDILKKAYRDHYEKKEFAKALGYMDELIEVEPQNKNLGKEKKEITKLMKRNEAAFIENPKKYNRFLKFTGYFKRGKANDIIIQKNKNSNYLPEIKNEIKMGNARNDRTF
jgi:hypothetical protein